MFENKKFVTVFGSSIPREGENEYEIAYTLGKKLAENKINVCSGGFQGIMDAVSKGANEKGGEAVGVTLDIYNAMASKHLTKQIVTHTLFDRLKTLVEIGDAYIILQGGTGTMLELSLIWEYLNKGMIDKKTVVCHGKMWKKIVSLMEEQIIKEKRRTGLIKCFDEIDDCAEYIIKTLK